MKHRVDERFFRPRGLALIGASADPTGKAGLPHRFARAIGYQGGIYPVNPKYQELAGLPCYPSVADIPGDVDMSLMTVPARLVPQVLADCGRKGVPYNIITTGGFAEAGAVALQEQIKAIAREHGIHIIGPNCLGVINLMDRVAATFATYFEREHDLVAGNIGLVSQSGGLGITLVNGCEAMGTPVAVYVSTGNEADLGALDFVEAFLEEPRVKVISGFIESFNGGADLVRLGALSLERRKPMVFVRAVGSERARAAALSHTGKIAGATAVGRAVLRQAGAIETEDLAEFLDAVHLFSLSRVFPRNGMAILTISGGVAVLAANICDQYGLNLPQFGEGTRRALQSLLPPFAALSNPVDTTPPRDLHIVPRVMEVVLSDGGIHSLLVTFPGRYYNELEGDFLKVAESAAAAGKIILVAPRTIVGSDYLDPAVAARFRAAGVPVFENPLRAVRALSRLVAFSERLAAPPPPRPAVATAPAGGSLGPASARSPEALLRAYGIPFVESRVAKTAEEAEAAARELGFPAALKVVSPEIAHKTDVGGVALNLPDEVAVREAFDRILGSVREMAPEASIGGVEVQKMVPAGVEVMVSGLRDPEFGPVVAVGFGGILAEVVAEVRYRVAPVDCQEAREMIVGSRLAPLLRGYRGSRPADLEALADCVARLSRLIAAEQWIKEIELNPVIVGASGEGIRGVDLLLAAMPQDV